MKAIHARAFVEAEQHPFHRICVVTKDRKKTRPAIPKDLWPFIRSTDYDPDQKFTTFEWVNESVIFFTCIHDKIATTKSKLYLFEGKKKDWAADIYEPLKSIRFFNKDLDDIVSILSGKSVKPYNSKPVIKFIEE